MTDLLTLAIIASMALFGRARGTVGMLLLAGGLCGGYLAALLLFRPLGRLVSSMSGFPGIIAYPLAGMGALFVVSTAVSHIARKHRRERALKAEDADWQPTRNDEIGGMVLGGAYGLALAVIISWAGMSLGGLLGSMELPAVRESLTGRLSTGAVRRAIAVPARAVVGDGFVASGVARVVADPFMAIGALNGIMSDSGVRSLLGSGVIQEAARMQDASLLAGNSTVVDLAGNETFASAMRTFGLLDGGSGAADPTVLAEAIVREAGPALRSIDALTSDPEVSSILESPAFRQTWDQADFMRMAQGADFRRLFDRVLEELRKNR